MIIQCVILVGEDCSSVDNLRLRNGLLDAHAPATDSLSRPSGGDLCEVTCHSLRDRPYNDLGRW